MIQSPNYKNRFIGVLLAFSLFLLLPQTISATCGGVDYSWGADGLSKAALFAGSMIIVTIEILEAIAAILAVVSALQIAIKMNYHEGDITKSVLYLFGAIIFMISASILMPAFFGYKDMII